MRSQPLGIHPPWRSKLAQEPRAARGTPDVRRLLQLALAGTWLLDGLLQYQSFMFSNAFEQMLAGTASGNQGSDRQTRHLGCDGSSSITTVLLNSIFATIQLLLGDRDRMAADRAGGALAASIAWSLGVWWFGEGLGMGADQQAPVRSTAPLVP